jgi:hypothetical protein
MVTPTKFYFTSHARRRSGERAIDLALFKKIVLAPDCKKQQYRGSHGGFVYLFSKTLAQGELHIAAELYKDECYFVTGYWV